MTGPKKNEAIYSPSSPPYIDDSNPLARVPYHSRVMKAFTPEHLVPKTPNSPRYGNFPGSPMYREIHAPKIEVRPKSKEEMIEVRAPGLGLRLGLACGLGLWFGVRK